MKIGFIGAGQMARALACGFVQAGRVAESEILAADVATAARAAFAEQLPSAQLFAENAQVLPAEILFVAVKPQYVAQALKPLRGQVGEKLVISIAAGVQLAQLVQLLQSQRVIRVMPNTPCLVGQGAAGFCRASDATAEDAALVQQLLEAVGLACEVPESLMDAVTGLSGSGPAYVYQIIEALSDGGVQAGLPREVAQQLATQTVLGAAEMVRRTQEHPAVLKDRVASPGGTTMAGLYALEQGGLRATLMAAVEAATRRSRELGEAARQTSSPRGRETKRG